MSGKVNDHQILDLAYLYIIHSV